ncbi:MAG: hypothetical protein KJ718_00280 [Nanoarchaeota archaeon]|nr:hypothetical protein [Nanoarchaeota archaeon]
MKIYTKLGIFAVLALVFIALAVRTTFFYSPMCQTFECYEKLMRQCKPANYLNDGEEATWRYEITGIEDSACVVKVTLLQSKVGELGMERLAGYSMECGFPKGVVAYPEKDLGMCHGRLKEEMQGIIIKRLHTYIVDNIGEIDETLDLLVEES